MLRVFAPLGVLLPPGVGLKIDAVDIGHAPFLRCHTFACYAQVTVEDKLIDQLKTGKTAIFIIFQTEESGHRHPDLAGRVRRGARVTRVAGLGRRHATRRRWPRADLDCSPWVLASGGSGNVM